MRAWQLNGHGGEILFSDLFGFVKAHFTYLQQIEGFHICCAPIRHIFSTVIDCHSVHLLFLVCASCAWCLLSSSLWFLALCKFGSTEFGLVVHLTTPVARVPMSRALTGEVVLLHSPCSVASGGPHSLRQAPVVPGPGPVDSEWIEFIPVFLAQ